MRFHAAGATLVRVSISLQLQEYCAGQLLDCAVSVVDGRLVYVIEGEQLSAVQAADGYLGGYQAAFGRSGAQFEVFLAALDAPKGWTE